MPAGIVLGIDKLIPEKSTLLKNAIIGLITNHTGLSTSFESNVSIILKNGLKLKYLFSPEHGIYGEEWDTVPVKSSFHNFYNVEIISLFNEENEIPEEKFSELDIVIYDIQDVGVRFYTYISTLYIVMELCRKYNIKILVLDRPNPISCEITEGEILEKEFESFFGVFQIPVRYGLTIGDLALRFNEKLDCDLEVLFMQGYERRMFYDDTGLVWIPPSPCMPTLETAIVYSGTALFEGTNVSEGRGTTMPFQVLGSPWIEGRLLADNLNKLALEGVFFREAVFKPLENKYHGETCQGVQIHILDKLKYKAVKTGVVVIEEICRLYPHKFRFIKPHGGEERFHFDLLWGNDRLRKGIQEDFLI